jgi:HD-like signal output (HDOD) protein
MKKPTDPTSGKSVSDPLFPELSLDLPGSVLPGRSLEPQTAAEWVAHIREQDMPALGATVVLIQEVTGDERATNDRLAQVILQDPAMTAKVLKLANSAFYNPSRQSISTISRAIIVLGFNTVAEISLGIRLVDSLLSGGVQQRVLDEMALSFHAAVQARTIAGLRRDGHGEEVFICSLLGRGNPTWMQSSRATTMQRRPA